jgi:hypothetical protein
LKRQEAGLTKLQKEVPLQIDAADKAVERAYDAGWVAWINKSTGAQFALMSRNVVAGEFTKVVQRVPVRIAIEKDERWPLLRAGLSVQASIAHGLGDPARAEQAAREMRDVEARYKRPQRPVRGRLQLMQYQDNGDDKYSIWSGKTGAPSTTGLLYKERGAVRSTAPRLLLLFTWAAWQAGPAPPDELASLGSAVRSPGAPWVLQAETSGSTIAPHLPAAMNGIHFGGRSDKPDSTNWLLELPHGYADHGQGRHPLSCGRVPGRGRVR